MDRIPLYYMSRTHFLHTLSKYSQVVVAVEAEYSVVLVANLSLFWAAEKSISSGDPIDSDIAIDTKHNVK